VSTREINDFKNQWVGMTTEVVRSFSAKDFVRRCRDEHIPRVAFGKDDGGTVSLSRVEHVCTVSPSVTRRAFPEIHAGTTTERDAFHWHGEKFKMCFFADEQRKHFYCGVKFTERAEGPPGNVHGGCIASVLDVAVVTFAAHYSPRVCVTKDLRIIYERPIPLGSEVVIRCWFYQVAGKRLVAHCDLVSPDDLTRFDRGFGTLSVLPDNSGAPPTSEVEPKLLKLTVEQEEEQETAPPRMILPRIEFPADSPLLRRFEGWEVFDFFEDFPDIVNRKTRGFLGMHRGEHFDFLSTTGTMIVKLFRKEKKVGGLVYFSKYAAGPPGGVHGGAIAAALDAVFGDSVFYIAGWGFMTRMLSIEYKRPLPPNTVVMVEDLEIYPNPLRKNGMYVRGKFTDGNGKVFCEGFGEFASAARRALPYEELRGTFGDTSGKSPKENLEGFLAYARAGDGKL